MSSLALVQSHLGTINDPTRLRKSDLLAQLKWLQANYFHIVPSLPSLSYTVSITWHFASWLHSRKQCCFFPSADLLVTTLAIMHWQNHAIQISGTYEWGRLPAVAWKKNQSTFYYFLLFYLACVAYSRVPLALLLTLSLPFYSLPLRLYFIYIHNLA